MTDTTAVCVSFNACDALALTVESFRKYHPDLNIRWLVYDNGSTDGALEYAQEFAETVIHGDNTLSHGECLTELCQRVDTEYVLTLDNDLEFTGRVWETMLAPLQDCEVYGSCLTRLYPFGQIQFLGKPFQAQWSPNIACGLMEADRVKQILDVGLTFGYYFNDQRAEFFETGAMFWRAAKACGWRIEEIEELWESVIHYGSVSTLWLSRDTPLNQEALRDREIIQERYANIQTRLQLLRNA